MHLMANETFDRLSAFLFLINNAHALVEFAREIGNF